MSATQSESPAGAQAMLRDPGSASSSALEWRTAIERRGALCHGRGRLADTLHALALDISGYDDGLPPAERIWLREAIRMPVSHAAEAALDTLTRELARTLRGAPEQVRPPIVFAGSVSRIDFE